LPSKKAGAGMSSSEWLLCLFSYRFVPVLAVHDRLWLHDDTPSGVVSFPVERYRRWRALNLGSNASLSLQRAKTRIGPCFVLGGAPVVRTGRSMEGLITGISNRSASKQATAKPASAACEFFSFELLRPRSK